MVGGETKIGRGGFRFSITLQRHLQETKKYLLVIKGFLTYPYVWEMCSLEAVDKKGDCNSTTEAVDHRFSIK